MNRLDEVTLRVGDWVGEEAADASTGRSSSGLVVEDQLGRSEFADDIVGRICKVNAPFTVAVYGSWGEGKTQFLRSVQKKAEDYPVGEEGATQGICTVWFDPWQHQHDVNPLLAMLQTACNEIPEGDARRKDAKSKVKDIGKALLLTAVDVGVSAALGPVARLPWMNSSPDKIYDAYKSRREAQLDVVITAQEEQTKLRKTFHETLDLLAGDGRVVFFIDDLDRCLPDKVVKLLEQIKMYMDHSKCVFVLGVDEKAVVRAIQHEGKYTDPGISEHYLEKMVQYAFDLPPVAINKRDDYIISLLRQTVGDSAEWSAWFNLIVKPWLSAFDDPQVGASVRLIKRTVNTFSADCCLGLRQLGKDFNPLIMAVLSAIRTCYREAFDQLRRRPEARKQEFWRQLFEYSEGPDSYLDSVFCRKGDAWKDLPGQREPGSRENPDRLGHSFVQTCQNLHENQDVISASALTVTAEFPQLVEDHFRLASSDSGMKSSSGAIDQDGYSQTAPPAGELDAWAADDGGVAEESASRPVPGASSQEETTPRQPIQTLDRMPGLVDYFTRRPSEQADVDDAVTRIKTSLANGGGSTETVVVRLSGIDWRVLALSEHDGDMSWPGKPETQPKEALLLADRVIGTGPYNKARLDTTWQRCDLRQWLNGPFLKSLGEPLRARINRTSIVNEENPTWGTRGGENTSDHVFLLSLKQTMGYLAQDWAFDWKTLEERRFVDARLRASSEDGERVWWWWLRSPGGTSGDAARVTTGGYVRGYGINVSAVPGGVRPAFRLNLES